jgi:aarF domain-containing kinase
MDSNSAGPLEYFEREVAAAKLNILNAATEFVEAEAAEGSAASRMHARNARRLIDMARASGGCYLKIAQHLAQLSHLLPPEYVSEAATCLDDCPVSAIQDVRAVIYEELGQLPEDLWDLFEATPIASASLAQVHVAFEKGTGRKLAIKVQHRGLRETAAGDIDACTLAVHVISRLFPAFKLAWLVDEIAPALPRELDFNLERANCLRAHDHFSTWDDVVVPAVVAEQSTARVLTMSFEEGFNATDKNAMVEAGIDTAAAAELIGRTWLNQTYRYGFVHCDPHAGNVLVRRHIKNGRDTGRPQVVLLDHGLYRELDDDFRLQYAAMWKALVLADLPGIERAATALGVGEHYPLFSAILTQRPWDDIIRNDLDSLRGGRGAADDAVIRAHAQRYAAKITQVLDQAPRQLLLLLKMQDCLRNINRSLGATHNEQVAVADACLGALFLNEMQSKQSAASKFRAVWSFSLSKSRLRLYELRRWWKK